MNAPSDFSQGPATAKSKVNASFHMLDDHETRIKKLEQNNPNGYSPITLVVCQGSNPKAFIVSGLLATLTPSVPLPDSSIVASDL